MVLECEEGLGIEPPFPSDWLPTRVYALRENGTCSFVISYFVIQRVYWWIIRFIFWNLQRHFTATLNKNPTTFSSNEKGRNLPIPIQQIKTSFYIKHSKKFRTSAFLIGCSNEVPWAKSRIHNQKASGKCRLVTPNHICNKSSKPERPSQIYTRQQPTNNIHNAITVLRILG